MKIASSFRKASLAALIAMVLLALALASAAVRSYWQPVVIGVTWRDVYAIKIDHGILQTLLGQNLQLKGDAATGYRVESIAWSANSDFEQTQAQATVFSGVSGIEGARRTQIQLRTWPPFSDSGAMGTTMATPKNANGQPVELLIGRWFFARSASAWPIAAALGAPAAAILFRRWRQKAILPGHCRRCGYDVRACVDRCSECGEPFVSPASWVASSYDESTS